MRWAVVLLSAALSVAFIYRFQLANGFDVLGGDRFDAVISASILEHWHKVFSGKAWWSDAQYFYPHARTIAQTDGYFLVSIPYHVLRLLSLDPLLAQEVTGMVLRIFGFVAFYVFCSRGLRFDFWPSLVGSVLFTTVAASSIFIHRTQLSSLVIAPVVSFYLVRAFEALGRSEGRAYARNGAIAAVVFSLWCLTCFYMAWFYLYFLVLLLLGGAVVSRAEVGALLRGMAVHWRWTGVIVLAGLVSAVPFVYAYALKALEVGVRHWDGVAKNLVYPWDLVLMHPGSLGGAGLPERLLPGTLALPAVAGEYSRIGFSPFMLLAIVLGLCGARSPRRDVRLMAATALAVVVASISVVKVGGLSLWQVVHAYFPGARALNAVSTIFIFLSFPATVLAAFFFQRYARGRVVALVAFGAFMVLEINKPYVNLDRRQQLAMLDVPPPPATCRVFFVEALDEQKSLDEATQWTEGVYPHNVAALFLAQRFGVPTINGMASFNPPDWNFAHPARPDYDERVRAYIESHQLRDVCRLNIEARRWSAF